MEFRQIATNGIRLHTAVDGPEDGELVILLHGFPEFWKGMQAPMAAFAAAGYRVAVPDQRGYNLSDKPAGVASYAIDVLADDVLGLIDAFGRERAHVIGHDWGAAVTWWLAARNPERLGRVAVVNVPHPDVLAATILRSPRQALRSWYIGAFQVPMLPDWVLGGAGAGAFADVIVRTARPGSIGDDYRDDLVRAWRQPGAATGMLNWYRAALRTRSSLPDPVVHEPILILWGVHDVALGPDLATASLRYCDEGHLVTFDDATHWLLHDEPERAVALLLDWVAGEPLG